MMASCPAAPVFSLAERPASARFPVAAEAAIRRALAESFENLEVCDRNMLRFHYFHGLTVDQLAEMFCSHRAAVVRQLARIRERMLRDLRRGVATRLLLDRPALDQLLEVVRDRFDLAITRLLRT
jgi:RNA polymerase sigma-70 factor (ECF subfamily)